MEQSLHLEGDLSPILYILSLHVSRSSLFPPLCYLPSCLSLLTLFPVLFSPSMSLAPHSSPRSLLSLHVSRSSLSPPVLLSPFISLALHSVPRSLLFQYVSRSSLFSRSLFSLHDSSEKCSEKNINLSR